MTLTLVLSLLIQKVFIFLIANTNFDVYSKEDQEKETYPIKKFHQSKSGTFENKRNGFKSYT